MFIRTNDKTEYKRRNENKKKKSADVNQFTKYFKHAEISLGLKRRSVCVACVCICVFCFKEEEESKI